MTHHGTVLVVEDDRPLQDALVSTLETAGFHVLAAGDGGEALKVLNDNAVDLIVSDVQMQPVDGRELLRRLQQRPSAQTPPLQSLPTLHVAPRAHGPHEPPQSASVSIPFFTPSLHRLQAPLLHVPIPPSHVCELSGMYMHAPISQ